jgi:hypothetical protein
MEWKGNGREGEWKKRRKKKKRKAKEEEDILFPKELFVLSFGLVP